MKSIIENIGYSYTDLTIVPARISQITSRSMCNPFDENGMLPLFTAPMSSVVNEKNFELWKKRGIIPILPRNVSFEKRVEYLKNGEWVAMSLNEYNDIFVKENKFALNGIRKYKVCIDIANGHMIDLYETIKKSKNIAYHNGYEISIITGNIANPETYDFIRNYEVDYIRLSIGSGNGCITTSNTGIHYPIASLIDACNDIRTSSANIDGYEKYPKIIADGGIRNYSDAIKALALGADYVMVGSLFSSFIESAALMQCKNIYGYPEIYNVDESILYSLDEENEKIKRIAIESHDIKKIFYGMSTKRAQIEIGNNINLKTSEGCEKMIDCKYTLSQWTDNFISYLKSAMSYTNCKTLKEFRCYAKLIINSQNETNSVNK